MVKLGVSIIYSPVFSLAVCWKFKFCDLLDHNFEVSLEQAVNLFGPHVEFGSSESLCCAEG